MQIAGLQRFTMVDYPGLVAATVFTRGCSFRCPFCHNPELVDPKRFSNILFDEGELMDFFKRRSGKLQGVCITGGEPTLQSDLLDFVDKLKSFDYAVKLDTNGWNPKILKNIIDSGKIDYIAMDIKTTLEKYPSVVNPKPARPAGGPEISPSLSALRARGRNPKQNLNNKMKNEQINEKWKMVNGKLIAIIKESVALIMQSGVDYEFRTTVCHPIHEVEDFREIGELIKGAKRYFIQNFVQSKHNDESIKFTPFLDEELEISKQLAKEYLDIVELR